MHAGKKAKTPMLAAYQAGAMLNAINTGMPIGCAIAPRSG